VRDVIRGETQTVLRFLANASLGLDYYQREYVWTEDHIDQFVEDLVAHIRYWETGDNVLPWYLGTVMVHQRGSENFLVDGQQRCATLLATLLAMRPKLSKGSVRDDLDLALGIKGKKLLAPMIDRGYQDVFAAKFADSAARNPEWTPGQKRIAAACDRLRVSFSAWADETDWNDVAYSLLHKTIFSALFIRYGELVQEIFIGINSRGARLGQLEQVKNALLGKLPSEERREIGDIWNDIAHRHAGADADRQLTAFAAAALARYAPDESFRKQPGDAQLQEPALNWLAKEGRNPATAARVGRDLPFFVRAYEGLAMLVQAPDEGLEAPHFLASCGLELEHWAPFVMASLEPDPKERAENARRVAASLAFLDVAAARLAWTGLAGGMGKLRETVHRLTPVMRSASAGSLVQRLEGALQQNVPGSFDAHEGLRIGKDHIRASVARALMTRLTARVEHWAAVPRASYTEFAGSGPGGFVIGHLIPVAEDTKGGLFGGGASKMSALRDRFGALVLVQPDLADRLRHQSLAERASTLSQAGNALAFLASAASLSEHRLRTEVDRRKIHLGPYEDGMKEADIREREEAFSVIAREIWPVARIAASIEKPDPRLIGLLSL
jgi:hypothetical protein